MEKEIIKILTHRYGIRYSPHKTATDEILALVDKYVKEQLFLHGVVGRSEQLVCQCDEPANWTTDEGFKGCVKCKKEVVGN